MAEMDRVYEALRNAHAAGDTAAATTLANYIKSVSQLQQEPSEPPEFSITPTEPTILGSLGRGTEQLVSSIRTPFEALFTSPEEAAIAATERSEDIGRGYGPSALDLDRLGRLKDEKGWLSAIAQGISEVPAAVTEQSPQMAAALAATRAGAKAGSPFGARGKIIGGAVGGLGAIATQLLGSGMERQAATDIAEGRPVDIDMQKALIAAGAGAVPEYAAQFLVFGKTIMRNILKLPVEQQGAKLLADATTSYRRAMGGAALRGAAGEMPTEVAQQVLERWQAGLDLTSDEAMAEYGQAALVAGVVGGVAGGGAGAVDTMSARAKVAEIEQQKQTERDRLEAEQRRVANEKRIAEGMLAIPADKEGVNAWARDILKARVTDRNIGDAEGKGRWGLLKVLDGLGGANLRDPAQAAKVKAALEEYAGTKNATKETIRLIETYLQNPLFANLPKTTQPPIAPGAPVSEGMIDEELAATTGTGPQGQGITGPTVRGKKSAAAPPAAPPAATVAGVTPATKTILTDLGYTEEQIAGIDQDQAEKIIEGSDPELLDQITDRGAPVEGAPAATTTQTQPENTVAATWANKDVDQPIFVYNEPAQPPGSDGRAYSRVRAKDAQQDSFVPTDEIKGWTPPKPVAAKTADEQLAETLAKSEQERAAKDAQDIADQQAQKAAAAEAVKKRAAEAEALRAASTETQTKAQTDTTEPTTAFKLTTADLPALGVLKPALRNARFKEFDTKSPEEQAAALEDYFDLEPVKLNTSPEKQAEAMRTIAKLRGQSVSVAPKKEESKKEEPENKAPEKKAASKEKKPRKSRSKKAENIPAKRTSEQKRDALLGMGFTNGEIDEMSEATQDTYLDLELRKLPLTQEGKYILPMLDDNARMREYYKIDEDGKKAITALTNSHPLSRLEQKIEAQEKLTPAELAAWYFHTYEPASAIIVMEQEAAYDAETNVDKEGNEVITIKPLTEPEILGVKTSKRTQNDILKEAVDNIAKASEWLDNKFSKNTQLQLVRAKARAAAYKKAQAYFSRYVSRRKTDAEIQAMNLLSGFGRAVGVGDFYVGMGINNTFDPSKSSDDVVERNNKVDKEIYEEPGETQDAVKEGEEVGVQDKLLTEVSSFKAFKEAIQTELEEGETLKDALGVIGITTAKQFKTARAAALKRRGNLTEAEAEEVVVTGELVDAVAEGQKTTWMSPEEKARLEAEIAQSTKEFLRTKEITVLPEGPGGREGTLDPRQARSRAQIRSYLRTPKFRGPDFNPAIRAAVEKGDIRGAINELIKSNSKNAELVQLLRKLLPVVAKTKIVLDGDIPLFHSGMYVPDTDTVHLDSISGMNEHTLLHEIFHSGLARIVGDPKNKLSKQWQELFSAVKTQLGDAYGGTNMQEFGAELGGNPEFQALLKTIKAPRSENLFRRIWETFLEAIGIGKRATAYDKAMQLVGDILDISVGLDPLPGEAMFLGGNIEDTLAYKMQMRRDANPETLRKAWDGLSELGKEIFASFMSINNMHTTMVGTPLEDDMSYLQESVMAKRGALDKEIDRASKIYDTDIAPVENSNNPRLVKAMQRMFALAIDIRRSQVEIIDIPEFDANGNVKLDANGKQVMRKFKPNAAQQARYDELTKRFAELPPEVQKVYTTIRHELERYLAKYMGLIQPYLKNIEGGEEVIAALKRATGYVPFLREGDYWYTFKDPATGEYSTMSETTAGARNRKVAELKEIYPSLEVNTHDSLESTLNSGEVPAVELMGKIRSTLKANMAADGIDEKLINEIEADFISMFPQKALIKQFKEAKMYPGMEMDLVRAYADQSLRWAHRITALEYNGRITEAKEDLRKTYHENYTGKSGKGGDPDFKAMLDVLEKNIGFVLNPNVPNWSANITWASYVEYIIGSISSGVVNTSALMTQVPSQLLAKHGPSALRNLTEASKNPTKKLDAEGGRYADLKEELERLGIRKHPMSREITQRGKKSLKDYSTLSSKLFNFLSIPFTWSEQYLREVTAIAAYDTARSAGDSHETAIKFAVKSVLDLHTAGMAEAAPRMLQNPAGRIVWSFKQIVFNQAFNLAYNFHTWVIKSNATPEERRFARNYLLGVWGTSFAFLGAKGLPFMGATTLLMRLIALLVPDDDDEPYDPRAQINEVFGDFFYNGLIANVFGVDISERAALANDVFFRDDPQSIRDYGFLPAMMLNLYGPMGSYFISTAGAAKYYYDTGTGLDRVIENALPGFARNISKGVRYYRDGITTRNGSPVVEDINGWQAAMQAIGFVPAEATEMYEKRSRAKNYEQRLLEIKGKILDKYYAAKLAGDQDLVREAQKEAADFRKDHPTLMNADTLERSYRSRVSAEEEKIAGLRFTKSLLPDIESKFFSD